MYAVACKLYKGEEGPNNLSKHNVKVCPEYSYLNSRTDSHIELNLILDSSNSIPTSIPVRIPI
jgi:hypothetical protein